MDTKKLNCEKNIERSDANMNFKRLSYEEYIERLTEEDIKDGLDKAFLPESLKNNTAEFYLIDNEEFWFYKKGNNEILLSVWEKSKNTIFDNPAIMKKIFEFLKKQGYKKIVMDLPKDQLPEKHLLMKQYGFTEETVDFDNNTKVIKYEKNL